MPRHRCVVPCPLCAVRMQQPPDLARSLAPHADTAALVRNPTFFQRGDDLSDELKELKAKVAAADAFVDRLPACRQWQHV